MIIGFILAVSLDIHSTCLSLNSGNREVLLPFKTCQSQAIYQSIAASSVVFATSKFKKKHPKLTKFILIAGIASHSLAAYHNYRISK